jgi:hypothetical protein
MSSPCSSAPLSRSRIWPGRRTRLTLQAVFPSAAERDRVVKEYGADKGARETLARLSDYVAMLAG